MKTPWIAYRQPQPRARLRLFCLPYAGGAASIYRTWQAAMPAEIEVCPVQPPGRESRLGEPLFRRAEALAEALADNLDGWLDLPFAFFGHSLGSVVAYETLVSLQASRKVEPRALLVSARRAPSTASSWGPVHDLPDDKFRDLIRSFAGTPQEVLDHPELMELLIPLLRADFEINDTYDPPPRALLDCPVVAFGGEHDVGVPRAELEPWAEVTRGSFDLVVLHGDHFSFIHQPTALIEALVARLEPLLR